MKGRITAEDHASISRVIEVLETEEGDRAGSPVAVLWAEWATSLRELQEPSEPVGSEA